MQKARNSVESTFLTRGQGFGDEVKRRILLGTYALSAGYYDAYYSKAQKVRTLIRQEFSTAFETFDVLVTPTAPTTAFGLGTKIGDPYEFSIFDKEGKLAIDLGVYGAPETFLIDNQGIIRVRHVGVLTQEVWEQKFKSALSELKEDEN